MHCENKKGLLVVLSAPSGCGKDTVFRAIEALRDDVVESVSATTRAPRPGEVDGVNYFFKTRADFEKMIADGGFFEYAEYSGNYYGTPIAGVEQAIARGKVCFLIIEVQGAKNVMRICPDCVSTVSYTHLRAHETGRNLVCRLLLEKKKKIINKKKKKIYKKP